MSVVQAGCGSCGAMFHAPLHLCGQTVGCPSCSVALLVPHAVPPPLDNYQHPAPIDPVQQQPIPAQQPVVAPLPSLVHSPASSNRSKMSADERRLVIGGAVIGGVVLLLFGAAFVVNSAISYANLTKATDEPVAQIEDAHSTTPPPSINPDRPNASPSPTATSAGDSQRDTPPVNEPATSANDYMNRTPAITKPAVPMTPEQEVRALFGEFQQHLAARKSPAAYAMLDSTMHRDYASKVSGVNKPRSVADRLIAQSVFPSGLPTREPARTAVNPNRDRTFNGDRAFAADPLWVLWVDSEVKSVDIVDNVATIKLTLPYEPYDMKINARRDNSTAPWKFIYLQLRSELAALFDRAQASSGKCPIDYQKDLQSAMDDREALVTMLTKYKTDDAAAIRASWDGLASAHQRRDGMAVMEYVSQRTRSKYFTSFIVKRMDRMRGTSRPPTVPNLAERTQGAASSALNDPLLQWFKSVELGEIETVDDYSARGQMRIAGSRFDAYVVFRRELDTGNRFPRWLVAVEECRRAISAELKATSGNDNNIGSWR